MNKKIEKVKSEISTTEGKIKELKEHLKTLQIKEKQLMDEEVLNYLKTIAQKENKDPMDLVERLNKNAEDKRNEN